MSSRRVPGKVLRTIGDKPALEYLLERLGRTDELDLLVVATSTDPSDDAIVEYCDRRGVATHRGPLEDVVSRFVGVADRYSLDALVRVNGDSPLLDQRLVDRGVELFRNDSYDIVSNVHPRSFPVGQSVEVIATDALLRIASGLTTAEDREHVTAFIYRNPREFSIGSFEAPEDHSGLSFAIDNEPDAQRIATVISLMERPQWTYGWREIVRLAEAADREGGSR